ncbi:MAG: hypothetical protein QXK37_04145 [Candidatus Woesearchaeota archaeon]
MAERRIVVDNLYLVYEGLFNINDLYLTIDKWLREKRYDKLEKRNSEQVYKDGRQIELELEPWKKITDYARIVINITIWMTNIKEVTVKKDKHIMKMSQGKITLRIIAYLDTDYENKWEGKPYFYFLRTVVDKWIYRVDVRKYESAVADDTFHLYNTIKSFLNLYRFQ